ncbi:MAG TPA: hypothetical protein VD969_05740 [Symbiobacteriaceae bacterium]|nr:hypothetical protein [Symbiobacteriaceae bacterium]
MNAKAREIGATHTHFVNSHGLHDPNHYTTAHDLALIARYAMRNPAFRALVTTEEKEIPGFQENPPRKLVSHNQLLGYYDGITGVKNGYTEEALLTNVASAKRGDTELIAVVLGVQNLLWTSSIKLLDYGFSHFQSRRIVQRGDAAGRLTIARVGDVDVRAAEDLWVAWPTGTGEPDRRMVPLDSVQAPLAAGAPVGTLIVSAGGKDLGSVAVTAAQAVPGAVHSAGPTPPADRSWQWLLISALPLVLLALLTRRRRSL